MEWRPWLHFHVRRVRAVSASALRGGRKAWQRSRPDARCRAAFARILRSHGDTVEMFWKPGTDPNLGNPAFKPKRSTPCYVAEAVPVNAFCKCITGPACSVVVVWCIKLPWLSDWEVVYWFTLCNFLKITEVAKIFLQILTKNCLGYFLGDFFRKLIWSPWKLHTRLRETYPRHVLCFDSTG
jgi:hypothetical protein